MAEATMPSPESTIETDAYTTAKGEEEHILPLPNNRRLAYAHNGPPTSRTVIIFFKGLMSIGSCPTIPRPCQELNVHWISPTLPGMGNSSSREAGVPYHTSLARDMCSLLTYLYPSGETDIDSLYIAGGSYGTVQAQMLYGASYEVFPYGRKIVGCLLLAGLSSQRCHKGYTKTLSWSNYISVGPLARWVPFHGLQRLFRWVIGWKLRSVDGAKTLFKSMLFDKMDEDEKGMYRKWLNKNDFTEDVFLKTLAEGAIKCCRNWDGFMEIADVLYSDWGFDPRNLDEEHASKAMLVVTSKKDDMGGSANGWLVENYRSAELKVVPGGHISSMFYMDEIWSELISRVP